MDIMYAPDPTRDGFHTWLAEGRPGTAFPYFAGHLAAIREAAFRSAVIDRQLSVADDAWQANEDGLVELVQGRYGPGQYVYLAVKRKRKRRTL